MISNIFSEYVEPLLKDINHPELLQEWKLNPYTEEYERKIDTNLYKTSEKKKLDRHDSDSYWPTSVKDTIDWFSFIAIMEHTANIMIQKKA